MGEKRSADERRLDETIEESFPASDAPANTVETGTRVGPEPLSPAAARNEGASPLQPVVDADATVKGEPH